jgi:hypothetical protein
MAAEHPPQQPVIASVRAINRVCADPVDSARLTQLFDALWPQFEARVNETPPRQDEGMPTRPPGEILEDLVATVQSIDQRMRGLEDAYANRPATTGNGDRRMSP